ncbi:MAG: hypothetical protein ACP5PJ_02395 [Acidimicrobiales bacterium]
MERLFRALSTPIVTELDVMVTKVEGLDERDLYASQLAEVRRYVAGEISLDVLRSNLKNGLGPHPLQAFLEEEGPESDIVV